MKLVAALVPILPAQLESDVSIPLIYTQGPMGIMKAVIKKTKMRKEGISALNELFLSACVSAFWACT